ncbi:ATP-dependent RNA helicase [Labilithrix luteola]|uniref:ATP-dependent RNA helicase n=1 Tax=Labilithrix luteola TaxID=1391654 RepID=A0A0K1Q9B4_9BACT|nr:DEAD/DEAH box helicase [Labilithrix luteola]AKV02247.1 ATP-dependent RNA helicase [Labilithrix luteola]
MAVRTKSGDAGNPRKPSRIRGGVAAPWQRERGVDAVLEHWLASNIVKPCFTADETVPGREPRTSPFPPGLPTQIAFALRGRGVDQLYEHQAKAFVAARRGPDEKRAVVVATPTASGKSYCFHLPVLTALLEDPDARALYLYPTKALARDQEANLRELMRASGLAEGAVVYDGDTPGDARRAARERSGIVLTNPDMLHAGILPHHTAWARTFQNLKYVVVDEVHTYKGVFGSHVANVLRRLMRVARFHGSNPILIGATATIGNPAEHAARIFGIENPDDLAAITENGAPQGERRVFMFNPPVVNAELGIRASYVKQAVMLATDLVKSKVPTIVFGQSRNNVEVMLRYLRDKVAPDVDASRVMGYRGGYLPEQRREIERKLREGEVLCVVATNALELGIDIGGLDAVICAGYPGSVAATWQRFGRAGRRGDRSICVLVTSSAPLDQYLAREPDYLLGAPVEEARIDPDNPEILIQHMKCAAFELPFRRGERYGSLDAEETSSALEFLVQHRVLHESNGTFHWAADAYPANNVSLRSVGWDNVVIIDAEHDKTLAEIDWRGAHTMVHEQAIYQHDGECWQVEKFDYENHKAFVRKVKPDYWTDAMTYTTVSVVEEFGTSQMAETAPEQAEPKVAWPTGWGEVSVVEKVVGYKKIKFYTHENTGYGDVRLPEMQMHTTAFWLTVPETVCAQIPMGKAAAVDGLRGIGIALETVSTLALMCDPRDLGTTLGDTDLEGIEANRDDANGTPAFVPRKVRGGPAAGYSPTLFVYEHTPGGIGLSERIYAQRETLVARARSLIEGCPCAEGCPACVGPTGDGNRKRVAIELLRRIA